MLPTEGYTNSHGYFMNKTNKQCHQVIFNLFQCDIYTKPPECVDIIMRFSQLVLVHHEAFTAGAWKHESKCGVLSEHQLRKPSDVRRIMSSYEGSF